MRSLRSPAQPERAAAVPPAGVRARRGGPGRFRQRRAGRRPDGKRTAGPHVFRIVLSHSRKALQRGRSARQTTEELPPLPGERLLALRRRAAGRWCSTTCAPRSTQADWFDPELNPKVRSFAEHYGTRDPADPAATRRGTRARSKRGVELRPGERAEGHGRSTSLAEQNRFLLGLGSDGRRHAHPRHDAAAGRQALRGGREAGAAAAAGGALPVLPRGPADRPSRRPRRGRQGLLLGAAGVPGPHRLGALGRAAGAHLQRAAASRSRPHVSTSRAASARRPAHIAAEKISGVERGAAWLSRACR